MNKRRSLFKKIISSSKPSMRNQSKKPTVSIRDQRRSRTKGPFVDDSDDSDAESSDDCETEDMAIPHSLIQQSAWEHRNGVSSADSLATKQVNKSRLNMLLGREKNGSSVSKNGTKHNRQQSRTTNYSNSAPQKERVHHYTSDILDSNAHTRKRTIASFNTGIYHPSRQPLMQDQMDLYDGIGLHSHEPNNISSQQQKEFQQLSRQALPENEEPSKSNALKTELESSITQSKKRKYTEPESKFVGTHVRSKKQHIFDTTPSKVKESLLERAKSSVYGGRSSHPLNNACSNRHLNTAESSLPWSPVSISSLADAYSHPHFDDSKPSVNSTVEHSSGFANSIPSRQDMSSKDFNVHGSTRSTAQASQGCEGTTKNCVSKMVAVEIPATSKQSDSAENIQESVFDSAKGPASMSKPLYQHSDSHSISDCQGQTAYINSMRDFSDPSWKLPLLPNERLPEDRSVETTGSSAVDVQPTPKPQENENREDDIKFTVTYGPQCQNEPVLHKSGKRLSVKDFFAPTSESALLAIPVLSKDSAAKTVEPTVFETSRQSRSEHTQHFEKVAPKVTTNQNHHQNEHILSAEGQDFSAMDFLIPPSSLPYQEPKASLQAFEPNDLNLIATEMEELLNPHLSTQLENISESVIGNESILKKTRTTTLFPFSQVPENVEPCFEYSLIQKILNEGNEGNKEDDSAQNSINIHRSLSLDEANSSAERIFHQTLTQYTIYLGMAFLSWQSTRDEHGCMTLSGCFTPFDRPEKQLNMSIRVKRDFVSKYAVTATDAHRGSKQNQAQVIMRELYLLRLWRLVSVSDVMECAQPGKNSKTEKKPELLRVHADSGCGEIYTTLDAANRAARRLQVKLSHEENPKDEETRKRQKNDLLRLNARVTELDLSMGGVEGCWKSEFTGCGGDKERFEVRVEKVKVCGPKN